MLCVWTCQRLLVMALRTTLLHRRPQLTMAMAHQMWKLDLEAVPLYAISRSRASTTERAHAKSHQVLSQILLANLCAIAS